MDTLFAANPTQADIGEIANGSFESDGKINDIVKKDPNGRFPKNPPGMRRNFFSRYLKEQQ